MTATRMVKEKLSDKASFSSLYNVGIMFIRPVLISPTSAAH